MLKRENLNTGTKYGNTAGETAFVGSRVESKNRVTTFKVTVPYTDADNIDHEVSMLVKCYVPKGALASEYSPSLTRAKSYIDAELSTLNNIKDLAAGAIEWTIEDLA